MASNPVWFEGSTINTLTVPYGKTWMILILCLVYDPNQYTFFGFMGITAALVFCNLGAAYGTGKAGVGIASVGVLKSELLFKSLLPIIMAGILGIYGLIVSVILQARGKFPNSK